MIDVSDEVAAILTSRTFVMSCRASVTLAGSILAENLPVTAGAEEFDDNLRVPERVMIRIPQVVDGVDLTPTGPDSALAPYGQRLHIKIGIGAAGRVTEWLDRGEFLIWQIELADTEIIVTAVGLLALIDEARFVTAWRPTGTLVTSLRTLIEPALTAVVDADVTALDRAVPAALNDDEDRLAALLATLQAFPARGQVSPTGYLQVLPEDYYPDGPNLDRYNFTTAEGVAQHFANILEIGGAITREGLHNTVVVRGMAAAGDGSQVMGAVYDKTPGGATSLTGPFNPLPVPFFAFNPLMTTAEMCLAAAASILRRKAAESSQRLKVTCVPDPRTCGNDLVHYRHEPSTDEDREIRAVVEQLTLPYTSGSGPMTIILREVDG
jgi:hypothetical protein